MSTFDKKQPKNIASQRQPLSEATNLITNNSKQWQEYYNQMVVHIQKQLRELRNATNDLKKKINVSQNNIKKTLQGKTGKNDQSSNKQNLSNASQIQKQNINIETEKLNVSQKIKKLKTFDQNLINNLIQKILVQESGSDLQSSNSFFDPLIAQLQRTHNWLVNLLVKNRINQRKIKQGTKSQVNNQKRKAYTPQQINIRRIKSRKSFKKRQ